MTFWQPRIAICKQNLDNCLSKYGKAVVICNKSRMACLRCNEKIKSEKKAEKKERFKILKKEFRSHLRRINGIQENQKFYRKVWEERCNSDGHCFCEECGTILRGYSASYVSHIISKGSEPRLRYNKQNINILCFKCHQKWEFGNRNEMHIYDKNKKIILELKSSLIKDCNSL